MFGDTKLADVEIEINDTVIQAHKVVLYCRSEYFRDLLTQVSVLLFASLRANSDPILILPKDPATKRLKISVAQNVRLMTEIIYYLYRLLSRD